MDGNKQGLRRVGLGGVFSAAVLGAAWLPAACSSSGNSGGSGSSESSSGAASSSGASHSGSSSGTSSSATSSGGTSSSGGGSSGAGGDVQLVTPASILPGETPPEIRALTLVGSNLCWLDSQGTSTASIKCVPTTGGTVTTVLNDPTLDQNMTTDGTLLYFTWTAAGDAGQGNYQPSELDSVKVDGTSRTSLVTGFSTQNATHQTPASELFFAGGNFYFVAANNTVITNQLMSAPLAGTSSPTLINPAAGSAVGLAYADSTGVYFTLDNALTPLEYDFSYVPLGGGTVTTLYPGGPLAYPVAGQVTVVGSTVYFPIDSATSNAVTFMSATVPPTGPATTLGSTIMGAEASGMIGDAQDLYVLSDDHGIYTLSTTTGVPTMVDPNAINENFSGAIRALDSKNLYFGESGAGLWAHPR
jgi:hypothetical protein